MPFWCRFFHRWSAWSEPKEQAVVYAFFNPKRTVTLRQYQVRTCERCNTREEREVR